MDGWMDESTCLSTSAQIASPPCSSTSFWSVCSCCTLHCQSQKHDNWWLHFEAPPSWAISLGPQGIHAAAAMCVEDKVREGGCGRELHNCALGHHQYPSQDVGVHTQFHTSHPQTYLPTPRSFTWLMQAGIIKLLGRAWPVGVFGQGQMWRLIMQLSSYEASWKGMWLGTSMGTFASVLCTTIYKSNSHMCSTCTWCSYYEVPRPLVRWRACRENSDWFGDGVLVRPWIILLLVTSYDKEHMSHMTKSICLICTCRALEH